MAFFKEMRYNTNQYSIDFSTAINFSGDTITAGEFFAGGGGWTHGLDKVPGITTKWILNHDKVAISTNAFHHPHAKVYWADIYAQDEHELEYVDCVHASVECQDHSKAKAGEEKRIGSYTMGWELYRYIRYLKPLVLTIENVTEFKKWAPLDENNKRIKSRAGEEFERWKKAFVDLGYVYKESIREAADDGMPTRRKRYFGVFHHPDIKFTFPKFSHAKGGKGGKRPWVACRPHIDLEDEGISIFGREFNENLPRHLRKKYSHNTLRRIGYGLMKYSPQFRQFITQYFSGGLDDTMSAICTANCHQLITAEKLQFIMDHCRTASFQKLDEPLRTQLTRQTKQLVSFDNVICQYYGKLQAQGLDSPLNGVNCNDRHQLIRFEKFQFIAKYMNSGGKPEYNIQTIDEPLSTVLTRGKHQLITLLDGFDIKARFLRADELAACTTFPRDYFRRPGLKISGKNAVRMIGNAVPPDWAPILLTPNLDSIRAHKMRIENLN